MTNHDDYALNQLDPEFEDKRNAGAELAWQLEPRPVDPDIEDAAERQRPRGHIAFAGTTALQHYSPEL